MKEEDLQKVEKILSNNIEGGVGAWRDLFDTIVKFIENIK